MKLQRLYSHVRKAVDDYHMIENGDKIAIGLSGGKDSITLLYALAGLRRFYPFPFDITAITVSLGLPDFDLTEMKRICGELDVEYHIVETKISDIIYNSDKSPCYLCAKLRKGAFNEKAMELGCNKIAYAHHMDDVIETAFMSMIYEGRFYCFPPVTRLDETELTVIRPLIYTSEAEVIGFKNKYQLPIVKNPCPVDGATRREYAKKLIQQINLDNPGVKKRLFHAVVTGNIEGWRRETDFL